MNKKIEEMSEEELRQNLITSDFRGKAFKEKCLEILLANAYANGMADADAASAFKKCFGEGNY